MSKPKSEPAQRLTGRIVNFNLSPKGSVEGALVETASGIAQVNLSKGAALPAEWVAGRSIDARVRQEDSHGEHPVYALVVGDGAVTGRVARLNHARHGEINGFVLDDGTFVHLKPDGAKRFPVAVGDHVSAEGSLLTGPDARVVESTRVVRLSPSGAKRKSA